MAVEVGEGLRVVGNHGVEVQGLRVNKVGVRNRSGDGGPVGAEPAAETVGIVARAEVVIAGLGVALLALEFVIVLRASVGVGALAPIRIKIGVVADDAGVGGEDAGSAEQIFDIINRIAADGEHGNALAAEEDVFVDRVPASISFGEDVAAGAVPVELAVRLVHAAAVAIVEIIHAACGFELTFSVPSVRADPIARGVTGHIIRKAGEVIVAVGGFGEAAFLRATGVIRVRSGGDRLQVAPGINAVGFPPAMGWARRISGSSLCRRDAVQLIIGERLRARCVEIVGDAVDVAGVLAGNGIDEAVGNVDGVAA